MISAVICMSLRRVWHLCNLPCVYALFWLVSIVSYVLKSRSICFQERKYEINREDVLYLHSTLWRRALYGSLRLACGEDDFSLVVPTLAATKSTSKSQIILIYGSPEVETFQINWWTKSLIYWLKRGRKISVLRRVEDRMEEDFFHRLQTSEYRGPWKWRMNRGGRALQTGWVRFFKQEVVSPKQRLERRN